MPRSRYRFVGNDGPYFMIMTVNHWLPVFTRPETVDLLLDSWRYLREHHDFRLHGYVVLENHLHLIAGSPQIDQDTQRFRRSRPINCGRRVAILSALKAKR